MDIATTGSAVDFGDATGAATISSGMASSTRGVFKQGRVPSGGPFVDTMEPVSIPWYESGKEICSPCKNILEVNYGKYTYTCLS